MNTILLLDSSKLSMALRNYSTDSNYPLRNICVTIKCWLTRTSSRALGTMTMTSTPT